MAMQRREGRSNDMEAKNDGDSDSFGGRNDGDSSNVEAEKDGDAGNIGGRDVEAENDDLLPVIMVAFNDKFGGCYQPILNDFFCLEREKEAMVAISIERETKKRREND